VSWKSRFSQNWKAGVIGAMVVAGTGWALLSWDFFISETLIHSSYDVPFRHRAVVAPQELVVVYLDDDSHRELNQPYDAPWDRGLYAKLLERLTAENAKAVSFDIVFNTTNSLHPEGDEHLARAIKAHGRVALGAEYTTTGRGGWTFIRPIDAFYDAAAAWGMVQVLPDQDFVVRRHLHVPFNKDDDLYSSLTWELARLAGAAVTKDPQERYRERWLNYYGPPGALPAVSFHVALETNSICPPGFFSNRVVIVGQNLKTYYSGQRKDELRTPYTRMSFCPAVDVQATQTLNLMRGDWLTRTSPRVEVFIILLAGMVFGYGLPGFRALPAVLLAAAGALAVGLTAQFLFSQYRVWFPWVILAAAQIPLATLWSVLFNSVQLYVQNRLYQQSLQMYLSPKLVKKFASQKDLLKPGANKQVLTALFSDVANFTSLSEGMDSDQLARVMNNYFETAVSQAIHVTDGTVVKYIGDAIFAFWNAPDAQQDHALRACEAALLFDGLPKQSLNGRPLATRIGIHTGVANVGNFGSAARVDYTALGEAINLASRMEGLNKHLGTRILITSETQGAVAGQLLTRPLGQFRLKGFGKAVSVFELVGRLDLADSCRPLHQAFADALSCFRQGDLRGAEGKFRRALQIAPEDGPTHFYQGSIREMQKRPLPANWTGALELSEK
jgi:adenylate cyclase